MNSSGDMQKPDDWRQSWVTCGLVALATVVAFVLFVLLLMRWLRVPGF